MKMLYAGQVVFILQPLAVPHVREVNHSHVHRGRQLKRIGHYTNCVIIIIIKSTHVHCTYMVEEPISFSFAFRPRSNIGTDKSAAQSGTNLRHMHSRYLPNSNSFICGASHREAVSTIFKVFGMTRPRVGQNPRPPEL